MTDYDLCPECGYESFQDGYCYECDYGDRGDLDDDGESFFNEFAR